MVPRGDYVLVEMDEDEFERFAEEEGAVVYEFEGAEYMPVATAVGPFLIKKVKKEEGETKDGGVFHVCSKCRSKRTG
jgi:hypothetical protein